VLNVTPRLYTARVYTAIEKKKQERQQLSSQRHDVVFKTPTIKTKLGSRSRLSKRNVFRKNRTQACVIVAMTQPAKATSWGFHTRENPRT